MTQENEGRQELACSPQSSYQDKDALGDLHLKGLSILLYRTNHCAVLMAHRTAAF